MKKYINWIIVAVVGIILALAAFMFNLWAIPAIVNYQVGKTLAIVNGSSAWSNFVDTPVPMYFKVYFFNVENPEGLARGEKPKVKEVGPYVYKETRKKHDVEINSENDTIFYHQGVTFQFDAEKSSPLTQDDNVVIVNFVVHLVSQVIESLAYPVSLVDEILELALPDVLPGKCDTTMTVSVREILFDGLLFNCSENAGSKYAHIICSALKHFPKIKILTETDDGNIIGAILGYKNTSYDGLFEIKSGVKDFSSIGKIVSWEHQTKMNNWGGDYCNNFVGSYDVTLLPPFVTKDSAFRLFSTDVCTTAPVEYYRDAEVQGIPGLEFRTTNSFMGNSTKYPENSCYCHNSIGSLTTPTECAPDKNLDLSSCMNIPALVSYPHLLHANPYYLTLIDGLKPNPDLHETFIVVEPHTGVPLRGYKRFQLNILAKPNSAIRVIKDSEFSLFPVLWFEEGAELGDDQVSMLRDQLLKVLNIADIIQWVLIACGIFMVLLGTGMAIWSIKKERHHHRE